jgi:phage terminase small subunit
MLPPGEPGEAFLFGGPLMAPRKRKAAKRPPAPRRPQADKQRRFVEEYCACFNATEAARRAGFSAKTARQQGARLLSNVSIAAAVQARMQGLQKTAEVSAQDVLAELKRIAFSDLRQFADWGPDGVALKPSGELADDAARCVAEVSESKSESGGALRFKLHDKVQALTLLGRRLGLFPSKPAGDGDSKPVQITIVEVVKGAGHDA